MDFLRGQDPSVEGLEIVQRLLRHINRTTLAAGRSVPLRLERAGPTSAIAGLPS